MEDDDQFGDLYTDVLRPIPAIGVAVPPPPPPPPSASATATIDPLIPTLDPAAAAPFSSSSSHPALVVEHPSVASQPSAPVLKNSATAAADKDDRDDWMLGGVPPAVEPPASWDEEEDPVSSRPADSGLPHEGKLRILEEEYDRKTRVSRVSAGDANGAPEEQRGFLFRGIDGENLNYPDQALVIPGLSAGPAIVVDFLGLNGANTKPEQSEDWDSDSEDDLQIVLNDNDTVRPGGERNEKFGIEDDSDDEDGEEDLIIVTDQDQYHRLPVMEEQDWGGETIHPAGDGEKESGDVPKVDGVVRNVPGAMIEYSNHGLQAQHHSVYKYIRLGAAPLSGGPIVGAVGPPTIIPSHLALHPVAGRGRADWRPVGGRGNANAEKNYHTGFLPAGVNSAAPRGFRSGLNFTLSAHKTVFDIDIESFEEKPWRFPGVDISDFFNFELDEEKWKDYCKRLDQLRLESTMQSKILVYESGRSEQKYDPDLPPELAAAASHHDISVDDGHAKSDNKQLDFNGHGRGSIMRAPLLIGRAIHVEAGYGERLPSIDTRAPRSRDSDSIIEIVPQESIYDEEKYDDETEQPEKDIQEDHGKRFNEIEEDERNAANEHTNHNSRTFSGRKRELTARVPFAPQTDNMSFLSGSRGMHQASRYRNTPSPGGQHGERLSQGMSHRRFSPDHDCSADATRSFSYQLNRLNGCQNDKLVDQTEVNQSAEMSPAVADEIAREQSIEQQFDEPEEKLSLVDEIDAEDMDSDAHISTETGGDDSLVVSGKTQKLSSQVEQPAVYDVGNEDVLRNSSGDNSRAKSVSSKDYPRGHENGKEVIQGGRSGWRDLRRPLEAEELNNCRRDTYGRDARHEVDPLLSEGTAYIPQVRQQWELDLVSAHHEQGRNFKMTKQLDGVARQSREDNLHKRRAKEENVRWENSDDTVSRHRSKLRSGERRQRDEDLHLEKHIDGEWRGGNREESSWQRERNDLPMNRHENTDDLLIKKKRNEAHLRGRAYKEDTLHNRNKEYYSRRKRERDDGTNRRKKDDGTGTRDKTEDHFSTKHKDDSRHHGKGEDRQRLKQSHESTLIHCEREEEQGASRIRRAVEDKPSTGNGRGKDELRAISFDKDHQEKGRRQLNDQSRRGDHIKEDTMPQRKRRGDVPSHEKVSSNDDRSFVPERVSLYSHHPSIASDSQQIYRERHKGNMWKGKDTGVHEKNSQMLGKRKQHDGNAQRR